MAQFLGRLIGRRGEATRLGDKKSGLVVECNGWTAGVRVEASCRDADTFNVYVTTGSSPEGHRVLVGQVVDTPAGPTWERASKTR